MYKRICSTPTDKTDITKSGVIVVVRELRLSRNLTSSRHSSSSNLGIVLERCGGPVDVRIVLRNKEGFDVLALHGHTNYCRRLAKGLIQREG